MQVDPSVSAAVCLVSSQYYKYVKDFAQFYRSSLLYLAFISSKDLDPDRRQVSRSISLCSCGCLLLVQTEPCQLPAGFGGGHFAGSAPGQGRVQLWGAAAPPHSMPTAAA